ncbi:MAG: hypothetical protein C0467_14645 [Planctomycetaceae bacterium]|nr:hypothetical protein [Planctomycetaceae bacterium]
MYQSQVDQDTEQAMSAEVGGQLEVVTAPRSLFGPDYARLAVLVLVAVGIHGWLISHTAVPARDGLTFARFALSFSDPNAGSDSTVPRQRIEVIRSAEQPPGYPFAIWVTEIVLRRVCDLPTPDRSLLASQIANAMGAVLLVVPMYLIGRMLFGRNVGFAGAMLFQVLPVPARVTSDALSEGIYLAAAATAVMLGVRASRLPGIGGFLLCGLAVGCSYLVRPEGLLIGAAVGMVVVAAGLTRSWPRDAALGRLTALCVGVALVAVPYMVLIGKITNKPTSDTILRNPWDDQPGRPIWTGQPGVCAPKPATPLFAAWWDPKVDEGKSRILWAARAVWSEMIKALHYVVGALTLFALFVHRRRLFYGDWGLWVPITLSGIMLLLLLFLAARVGYVSERHTVLLVMLCCILGASAIQPLTDAFAKIPVLGRLIIWPAAAPAVLFLAIVCSALPYTLKPMHPHREGHKHAGRWLAGQISDKDWLQDPLAWAEFYAGRTLYKTVSYPGEPEYIWIVIEKGKSSPHSRLPQWDDAKQRVTGQTPVYRWPENASPDEPAVEVYKLRHKAVTATNPPKAP